MAAKAIMFSLAQNTKHLSPNRFLLTKEDV